MKDSAELKTHNNPVGRYRRRLSSDMHDAGLALLCLCIFLAGCSSGVSKGGQNVDENQFPTSTLAAISTPVPTTAGQDPVPGTTANSSPQTLTVTPPPAPTQTLISLPPPNPWAGDERINVLLLGVDYGDWNSPDRVGPPRSDTMLVLTLDPMTKTAGMLSIPRDLWVDIPGMLQPNRINTAHRFGELYELPGGGPALAARTVENLLGIPIHYYARIDFEAFERFVDELGGVEVDVPEEITVDPIGQGNTITLKAGKQILDGPTALAYARNRSTPGDETDRTHRQQQIILAIRDRMLRLDGLPVLVSKAPDLYRELSAGIKTNLSLDEAIQLAWLAIQIDPKSVQSAIIGPNQYIMDTTEEGWSIFRPIPDRIHWLVQQIFSTP